MLIQFNINTATSLHSDDGLEYFNNLVSWRDFIIFNEWYALR